MQSDSCATGVVRSEHSADHHDAGDDSNHDSRPFAAADNASADTNHDSRPFAAADNASADTNRKHPRVDNRPWCDWIITTIITIIIIVIIIIWRKLEWFIVVWLVDVIRFIRVIFIDCGDISSELS
jgi:hypothetical protein